MRYFFVKSHKKYVFLFTKTVEKAREIKHFRKKRRVKTLQKLTVFLTYKTLKMIFLSTYLQFLNIDKRWCLWFNK